jgi:hypothetical protein
MISRVTVTILTDASGNFSKKTPPVEGRILQYRYVPDIVSPLDTGADLDIALSDSGVVIADIAAIGTAAVTKAPRQATHGVDGAAALYAAGGEPIEDAIYSAGESLTITIASGGNAKRGTLYIWAG